MQGFMILASMGSQKDTLVFFWTEILTKSMEREMYVKGTVLWSCL